PLPSAGRSVQGTRTGLKSRRGNTGSRPWTRRREVPGPGARKDPSLGPARDRVDARQRGGRSAWDGGQASRRRQDGREGPGVPFGGSQESMPVAGDRAWNVVPPFYPREL